jgi:hypothetical protein
MSEEQDVHADHDGYQREHVKHDGCPFSHLSLLLRVALLVNLTGLSVGPSRSPGPPAPTPGAHRDLDMVREIVGHGDIEVTMTIYAHTSPGEIRRGVWLLTRGGQGRGSCAPVRSPCIVAWSTGE